MTRKPPKLTLVTGATTRPPADWPPPPPPPSNPSITAILNDALADHLLQDTVACIVIRIAPPGLSDATYMYYPPVTPENTVALRSLHYYLHRASSDAMLRHEAATTVTDIDPDDDGA